MNLAIDERTKHRLTGLAVIMAVAIIFVPAMLKKSNQRLEENIHLSVQLPPKPQAPKVNVAEKEAVLETVKVAKLPMPKKISPVPASQIARIEPLTDKPKSVQVASLQTNAADPVPTPLPHPPRPKPHPHPHPKPSGNPAVAETREIMEAVRQEIEREAKRETVSPVLRKEVKEASAYKPKPVLTPRPVVEAYAVQLASFTVQKNAESLVERLRDQGYKARYRKISSEDGTLYKVTVGQLDDKADASALKKKLSETTNMNGFVVKREFG